MKVTPPPFQMGQKVEWKHSAGKKIFRGNLIGWLGRDRYYAVVEDGTGLKPRIVCRERLRHPYQWLSWDDVR